MPPRSGNNPLIFLLFFLVLLGIEAVVDIIGLPLDEILIPGEGIVDLMLLFGAFAPQPSRTGRSRR
ncbi:MAG: hypothetical protein ACYC9S_08990 [Leptospirales bacterium]